MTLSADIVPLEKRGVYQGWVGGTWGIAGTLGPILGGLLTEKASWLVDRFPDRVFGLPVTPFRRWCFCEIRCVLNSSRL